MSASTCDFWFGMPGVRMWKKYHLQKVGGGGGALGYICSIFAPKSSMAAYKAGQYFRQYQLQKQLQPETDDEDSIMQVEDEDGNAIQSGESTQSNEIPSSSSSKKRKQGSTTKTSTSKRPKKFSWTADKAEDLLKYVREYTKIGEWVPCMVLILRLIWRACTRRSGGA